MPTFSGASRQLVRKASHLGLIRLVPNVQRGFRPVFLVGCARSGTTMLSAAIASHPQVAGWSEANDVWDPEWFESGTRDPRRPAEMDPEAFYRHWEEQAASRIDRIRTQFAAYQKLHRADVFFNKSPSNTFRMRTIDRVFPAPRYIHLVRDGRAVVRSYYHHIVDKGKLAEWPAEVADGTNADPEPLLSTLARFWKQNLEAVRASSDDLGLVDEQRILELRYEDFVEDPQPWMTRIADFIGIDPGLARAPEVRSPTRRWADEWTSDVVETVTAALEPTLTAHGYR